MVRSALEMIDAVAIIHPGDGFLVKPNCVDHKDPSTGVTTDPRVVKEGNWLEY